MPEELIQLVALRLRDYNRLTPASCADTLKGVWKRIQGQIPDGDIPTPIYAEEGTPPQQTFPKLPAAWLWQDSLPNRENRQGIISVVVQIVK